MTGTPQHSLHATVPRSAVWRVTCKLNPCNQALRMGDERFLSNVFKRFLFLLRFLTFFYFFSERFLHLWYLALFPRWSSTGPKSLYLATWHTTLRTIIQPSN